MSMIQIFEWAGSLSGMVGALLLAMNTSLSRYGWVAFLIANVGMIAFAWGIDARGLFLQQCFFAGTSLLGMYRTGLLALRKPRQT